MTNSETGYNPDWVSSPGDTIADYIEENDWTQAEFAKRIGYTKKHVNNLISGSATLGEESALRLEKVTGINAEFWLAREADYREALARADDVAEMKSQAGWLKELPVNDMVKLNWIEQKPARWQQVEECLRFFGVASPDAWRAQYEGYGAAYRSSPKYEKKPGATLAWLRHGEKVASSIDCGAYSKDDFRSGLENLRPLTKRSDPADFVEELKSICAGCGVAVVFAPTPTGCPTSAATRWLASDKALLMLSLRHKTNDHLWFSFFHEAGHILMHQKKMVFLEVDGLNNKLEDEADRFARDILIPPERFAEFSNGSFSESSINAFAESIGVAPAIVLGRLQHEGLVRWNTNLNKLKVRYEWKQCNHT